MCEADKMFGGAISPLSKRAYGTSTISLGFNLSVLKQSKYTSINL